MASQSDTSLEGTPGTIWGLETGHGSSSPAAGAVPVTLRALTAPVRAAPWSGGNFYEKVKSSGIFPPTQKRCFPHQSSLGEEHVLPHLLHETSFTLLLVQGRFQGNSGESPAPATISERTGLSGTMLALLGASRLCPSGAPSEAVPEGKPP